MLPRITLTRTCAACSGVQPDGCPTSQLKSAMGSQWPHGNLLSLLDKSRCADASQPNYTMFGGDRDLHIGRFIINDHEEVAWLSQFRPQNKAFLNIIGPSDSCLIIDCEGDSKAGNFIDLTAVYEPGRPPLIEIFLSCIRKALGPKRDFLLTVMSACGNDGDTGRTSYHLYVSPCDSSRSGSKPRSYIFTPLQRRQIIWTAHDEIQRAYGPVLNGVPTNKFADLAFADGKIQHSRAPFNDKRSGDHVHGRPLVPWSVFDGQSGKELTGDHCWMCIMKNVTLFGAEDGHHSAEFVTIEPDFQLNAARLIDTAAAATRGSRVKAESSSTPWKQTEMAESDPRRDVIRELLLPFVMPVTPDKPGSTRKRCKLDKTYDAITPDGSHVIKGHFASGVRCPHAPDKTHDNQRSIFFLSASGRVFLNDFACRETVANKAVMVDAQRCAEIVAGVSSEGGGGGKRQCLAAAAASAAATEFRWSMPERVDADLGDEAILNSIAMEVSSHQRVGLVYRIRMKTEKAERRIVKRLRAMIRHAISSCEIKAVIEDSQSGVRVRHHTGRVHEVVRDSYRFKKELSLATVETLVSDTLSDTNSTSLVLRSRDHW